MPQRSEIQTIIRPFVSGINGVHISQKEQVLVPGPAQSHPQYQGQTGERRLTDTPVSQMRLIGKHIGVVQTLSQFSASKMQP